MRNRFSLLLAAACVLVASAQEQIDRNDVAARGAATGRLSVRVRVTKAVPARDSVLVNWRRGGEGLGGTVVRGQFTIAGGKAVIPLGEWTEPVSLKEIVGTAKGWEFPSVVVTSEPVMKGKSLNPGPNLSDVVVDFEFAEQGKAFKSFTETAPKGSTVGFAFPGALLARTVSAGFASELNGLSTHARLRRERLEKAFPDPATMPRQFAVIGHMGGYGEGPPGLRGGHGFGVRHNNPAILRDEFRVLSLLGVNGMVDSIALADAAGVGDQFRRMFWGPPGSGNPMAFFKQGKKSTEMPDGCPFDPALKPYMRETVAKAIKVHQAAGAKESWGLWDDEMGVYAKDHIARCEKCTKAFQDYLMAQFVHPISMGVRSYQDIKPYPLWLTEAEAKDKKSFPTGFRPAPENPGEALRYYYTYRLMTHANGMAFTESARTLDEAGIKLYAMQGPTPSWNGSSLDWHEFYDLKPNRAFVFETSNRDARVWQWESYLADIGRGIAMRHGLVQGCLVKPHRGAPAQRMLSVVARGATALEWYTYGPDYSKGDSFSQSPELLEQVGKAARFLGQAEPHLYEARFDGQPEVAFVTPRTSEIWSRVTDPSLTSFENAKWVYLALRHAHIPVDVLSEQQLAEGKLARYKAIYVPGPHLHHAAANSLFGWVKEGGTLWTDATGLSRDEANQLAPLVNSLLGLKARNLESWGSVAQYRATTLEPVVEKNSPASAVIRSGNSQIVARVAREPLDVATAEVISRFADGKPAVVRNREGKGQSVTAGLWSGISYSATVRRPDFNMRTDFDPMLRDLIAGPAIALNVWRPAIPADPLVEAIALRKGSQRSVALINWSYARNENALNRASLQPVRNLRVELPGYAGAKSVSSIRHGRLEITNGAVILPTMDEIDLLLID